MVQGYHWKFAASCTCGLGCESDYMVLCVLWNKGILELPGGFQGSSVPCLAVFWGPCCSGNGTRSG